MSVENFLGKLKGETKKISFSQTMAMLEGNYEFSPIAFSNGELQNKAGENNGSCKIFYFGQLHDLSEEQTLTCFGEYYREVLQEPGGEGHLNIRNFVKTGWDGIKFHGKALHLK